MSVECRHTLSLSSLPNMTSNFQTQAHFTDFQQKCRHSSHLLFSSTPHLSLYINFTLVSLLLLYYTNPNPQIRMGSSSIEDFESYLHLNQFFGDKIGVLKDTLLQKLQESMETRTCNRAESMDCRDDSAAFVLKMIAIATILIFGVAGVTIPLLGKKRKFLRPESNVFFAAKAFAAGVILATGFVHMLSDATTALKNPCLPKFPWSKFPFAGFVAMMASLATLVADFVGTQFYERKQEKNRLSQFGQEALLESESSVGRVVPVEKSEKVFGEEEGGGMHIVGIHAHAAHHRHNHPHGQEGCDGQASHSHSHGGVGHSHSHDHGDGDDEDEGLRHVVVSQVLELGIVSHSVIIGLSLGVSQSPCAIRPLIAALSFHQFFEGFALGGCVSQAQFKTLPSVVMACFFAITTPAGVALGTGLASLYNPKSPRALVVEGILDSISAGILIYMALVDLIAADFLSKRMKCNVRLQVVSYFTLFLGASSMSLLAIWA